MKEVKAIIQPPDPPGGLGPAMDVVADALPLGIIERAERKKLKFNER